VSWGIASADRILGGTTAYGGVLASNRAVNAWEKRAEISGVSLNAGTNTSANEEYALAA
jgi:hypothetical protein